MSNANVAKEVIAITEVAEGKYGWYAKVGDEYYNSGKFFKGMKDMKAGNSYEVEVFTSDKGKKYVQKLIAMSSKGNTVSNTLGTIPVILTTSTSGVPAVTLKQPKSRDFDAEARGKTRCSCINAAAGAPLTAQLLAGGSLEDAKIILRELADFMYAYTFQEEK